MHHDKMEALITVVSLGIVGLAFGTTGCGPYPDRPNPSEYERPKENSDTGGKKARPDGGETDTQMDSGTPDSTTGDDGGDTGQPNDGTSEPRKAQIVDCSQANPSKTIELRDRRFVNGDATVTPGTTIRFTNREDDEHNVEYGQSAGDPDRGSLFASRTLARGESVCIRFENTGDYPYLCKFHPTSMQATITVRKSDGGNDTGGGSSSSPQVVSCSDREPAVTISINNRQYIDGSPTVSAGDVVQWTNQDDEEHTVVSGTGEDDPDRGAQFDSGEIPEGNGTFCVEFPAGTYDYYCRERGADEMSGTVTAK